MAIDLKYSSDGETSAFPFSSFSSELAPEQKLQSLNALILEDDPVDAAYLSRILDRLPSFNATYKVVSDTLHMRREIERFSGDIIIADLMLKGDTSISFLSSLANRPDRPPVLLLTGLDGSNVQEMAFRAGVDAFISKSDLEPRLLETLVRTALHTSDMRKRFAQMEYMRNRELCQTMARASSAPSVGPANDAVASLRNRLSKR